MNETQAVGREPEVAREQSNLNERLMTLDKCYEELRSEVGQMESTLRIALRPAPAQAEGMTKEPQPDSPPCVTPMGEEIRRTTNTVNTLARQLSGLSERLRDIRDRCELPRLPEPAQAMPYEHEQRYDKPKMSY